MLLVKHTYIPGWYLPGGGIEWGETFDEALKKELMEEAGVTLTDKAEMLAVYQNRRASRRDHVALYHCPHWRQDNKPDLPNHEILAAEFFPQNDLPEGTTDATKRRLAELEAGGPYSDYW